jgi:DNA-binding response OmpR family regulator
MLNVLVVEDDKELAGFVREGLEDESCIVKLCHDGGDGLRQAEMHSFDVILLDVMLPVLNGFEVTKRLRQQKIRTPIILLTARDAPQDIVQGLDAGADDYLTKPFEFEVLLARIRARTRSAATKNAPQTRFADLFLDTEKRQAFRAGQRLDLTRTEFSILECLIQAAGRVVTRSRIIELVWGSRDVSENNLDVFIRYLRAKVDPPGLPRLVPPSAVSATASGKRPIEAPYHPGPAHGLVLSKRRHHRGAFCGRQLVRHEGEHVSLHRPGSSLPHQVRGSLHREPFPAHA